MNILDDMGVNYQQKWTTPLRLLLLRFYFCKIRPHWSFIVSNCSWKYQDSQKSEIRREVRDKYEVEVWIFL